MGGQARGRLKTAGDPVHKHQPDLRVGREVTFDEVIATLYARKINCGVATFWNAGITVWIGDGMNGRLAETTPSAGIGWARRRSGWSTRRRDCIRKRRSGSDAPRLAAPVDLAAGRRTVRAL